MPTVRSARGAGTSGKVGTLRPSASVATQVSERLSPATALNQPTPASSRRKNEPAEVGERWRRIAFIMGRSSLPRPPQNSSNRAGSAWLRAAASDLEEKETVPPAGLFR